MSTGGIGEGIRASVPVMTAPGTAPAALLDRLAEAIGAGRADVALQDAAALRRQYPRDAEAIRLHALALLQLGHLAEAREALIEARARAPQSVEVACNLASVVLAGGDPDAAIALLEQALAFAPRHPAVLNGLGTARRAAGDLAGARAAYVASVAAAPDHPGAWLNAAAAALALGEHATAEHDVRQALSLVPGHPQGLLLLGHVLAAQRRHADAADAYRAGERAAPDDARFPYQVGLMAEEQKQLALAAAAHARALACDPVLDQALAQLVFLRRQLCEWDGLDALSARLRERVAARAAGIAPFAFLAEPARAEEQLRCASTYAAGVEARTAALRARLGFRHAPAPPGQPPRIGFVANGFGNHPTALLVVAAFEALRTQPLQLHLFSTMPDDGSVLLHRLRSAAHAWHDGSASTPAQLARAVHAAGIEVLVDLDGYCAGAMPETFALRPAPVQVNWLAYPGTLGAPWMDYVVADAIVLPDALARQFSERAVRLARCFQPNDPTRPVADPPSRESCGLPGRGVVFACFNGAFKITPAGLDRMLAILRGVPDAVLWLLAGPEGADARLRAHAQAAGIEPARLVFMPKLAHADYLARYRLADLFLDTAPYGAHTTASDAIWAGCPVLTLTGDTFASRVAASLNHHLGIPELNARDDADFIVHAVRLGRDAAALRGLRERVAARRASSSLFDMQGFAADFAAVLLRMSERWRQGLAPAAFDA